MNEDPKYWEEKILPWIQELKAKQEEARLKLLELEAVAYSKAGYVKVYGRYMKVRDKMTLKQMSQLTDGQWKERSRYYDPKNI
jgi:hypothetical protein